MPDIPTEKPRLSAQSLIEKGVAGDMYRSQGAEDPEAKKNWEAIDTLWGNINALHEDVDEGYMSPATGRLQAIKYCQRFLGSVSWAGYQGL